MEGKDQYILGYRDAEQSRLQRQADELAAESEWLFDKLEPIDGYAVVEIGCGPRGCLDLLSRRVGGGRVVGVERSEDAAKLARQFVLDNELTNVEVIHGDARSTDLPRAGFDLVTARLVLVNVPKPEDIVREAVELLRPGGTVAWHEADWALNFCDPPLAAWDRMVELFRHYAEANDMDLDVGRRLPRLLRGAGVIDVQSRVIAHAYEPGHPRRSLFHDFVGNLGGRFVETGLVSASELDEFGNAIATHLADPDTYVISHLYVQAWGRKPA
jgi:SAM-dependent methyltransferase